MAYQHNQKPSKCDHMHVMVNNNWACPQLRNMAAQQLSLQLVQRSIRTISLGLQLSCSTDRTIKLLRSLLWPVLSLQEARTSAVAVKVSKSRHNSTTKAQTKNLLYLIVIKCRFLLALQLPALSYQRLPRFAIRTHKQTNKRTDYRMRWGLRPPRHNNSTQK